MGLPYMDMGPQHKQNSTNITMYSKLFCEGNVRVAMREWDLSMLGTKPNSEENWSTAIFGLGSENPWTMGHPEVTGLPGSRTRGTKQ